MHRPTALTWATICLISLFLACSDDGGTGKDGGGPKEAGGDGPLADSLAKDSASIPGLVTTTSGPVQGTVNTKSVVFLGIPYASAPTGAKRWKAPQPPAPWGKPLDVKKFGASCPQFKSTFSTMPDNYSEDCLFLNVWTPFPMPKTPAPVMVWIHGGAFIQGGSATPTYSGQVIAEQTGTVLVSINYRLGPLGFLAHSAVEGGLTNAGLLDQQAALRWVQGNIKAFGGDPNKVTIFGESAGSVSVCTHLASTGSKGLFHRAIMESGGCSTTLPTSAEALKQGQDLAQALKCDVVKDPAACLRAAKADDLLKALPLKSGVFFGTGASWSPVIDNKVLTKQPMTQVLSGTFNKVPLLLGSNKDEGSLFMMLGKMLTITDAQYATLVNTSFTTNAAKVLAQYPLSQYTGTALFSRGARAFSDILTDLAFICPTRWSAQGVDAAGAAGGAVYQYHFTVSPSFAGVLSFLGSYHAAEIPFVFNTTNKFNAKEKALAQTMMNYWTSFAKDGVPTSPGAMAWPKYSVATDQHLELTLILKTGSALKKSKCAFWQTVYNP